MSWTTERGRVAALSRSRSADDPDLLNAKRNLRAERLADHVAKAVAEAPPFTEAQVERLTLLLRGGGVGG